MQKPFDGGFSFCGINIGTLGLEYVPEKQDTYVYRPSKYSAHEEEFEAHDGGYYFGTTMKPKEFTLRCYYEAQHINDGIMTQIFNMFRRGKTGKLVFQRRPWLWYIATVTALDDTQISNFMNGLIKISMKAYYPFGRTNQTCITDGDPNELDLIHNSAMLKDIRWDLSKDFAQDEGFDTTLQSTQDIDLYNPGTERAHVALEIAGNVGSGVYITNSTTNQMCKIVGLNTGDSEKIEYGLDFIVDSISGKCILTNGTRTEYGFLYHDNGYIDLEPGYPVYRNVYIKAKSGTGTVTIGEPGVTLTEDDVGKYFFINEQIGASDLSSLNNASIDIPSLKILGVNDDGSAVVNYTFSEDFAGWADIVLINNLHISADDPGSVNITKLCFKYLPTFS